VLKVALNITAPFVYVNVVVSDSGYSQTRLESDRHWRRA
jgi:hypothetical protein